MSVIETAIRQAVINRAHAEDVALLAGGRDWTLADVQTLVEFRGVYDGWSAAILKDGRIVNRWSPEDGRRYALTEEALVGWREAEAKGLLRDDLKVDL